MTQEEIKMKVQEILKIAEKRDAELINKYSNIHNYLAAKKAQKELSSVLEEMENR